MTLTPKRINGFGYCIKKFYKPSKKIQEIENSDIEDCNELYLN